MRLVVSSTRAYLCHRYAELFTYKSQLLFMFSTPFSSPSGTCFFNIKSREKESIRNLLLQQEEIVYQKPPSTLKAGRKSLLQASFNNKSRKKESITNLLQQYSGRFSRDRSTFVTSCRGFAWAVDQGWGLKMEGPRDYVL